MMVVPPARLFIARSAPGSLARSAFLIGANRFVGKVQTFHGIAGRHPGGGAHFGRVTVQVRRGSPSGCQGSAPVRRGSLAARQGATPACQGSSPVRGRSWAARRGSSSACQRSASVRRGSLSVRQGSASVRRADTAFYEGNSGFWRKNGIVHAKRDFLARVQATSCGLTETRAKPWSAAGSVSATPPLEGIAGRDTRPLLRGVPSQGGVGARSSLCHRTPRFRPLHRRPA